MNMKRLRTSIAAAMGAALLIAGLLVGASLALAQESDEPEVTEEDPTGDSLTRMFGFVQDMLEEETEPDEGAADDLAQISEELREDLAPLIDQIKERVNAAIDKAVDSGAVTEEQAERARDRVEAFSLPERFRFFERGFRFGPDKFGPMPDWLELPEDFELPEGFPFGPDGLDFGPLPEDFEFRFGPFDRFGEHLEDFVEDLDVDVDELPELLESGMSLDEALAELGTDLESVLADAREQALAKIDQLVEDGELTEEQADRIKEMLEGIDLAGPFPFGLHRLDLDPGEFPHFDRSNRGHGFFGPWEDFFEEDPAADDPAADE